MTTLDRKTVITAVSIIALVALAMSLNGGSLLGPENPGLAAPILAIGEFVVYFVAVMLMNPRTTIATAATCAFFFALIRFVSSMMGGVLYGTLHSDPNYSLLSAWANPISGVFQAMVLVFGGPYILSGSFPELAGKEAAPGRGGKEQGGPGETSPAGGFVQVFSYEELAGTFKKTHGLEGFVIYSTEGLIVWRDLPMRIDMDALVARTVAGSTSLGGVVADGGLTRMRRMLIESREHSMVVTNLNHNFGIILLFSARVPADEVLARIAVMAKTAREFLQWRYPALPMASGLSKERIPLESA